MTDQEKIRAFAGRALKTAGLLDESALDQFDMSGLTIGPAGRVIGIDRFVREAKAAKPEAFFNALTATKAEVEAGLRKLAADDARKRIEAESARFLEGLRRKYAGSS